MWVKVRLTLNENPGVCVRWTALSLHCYNFLSCWDMQLMGFSRKQVMTSREKWLEGICGNSLWFRCFSHIAWPQRVHKCWACLQCIKERCESACFVDFCRQRKRTTISQAPTKISEAETAFDTPGGSLWPHWTLLVRQPPEHDRGLRCVKVRRPLKRWTSS